MKLRELYESREHPEQPIYYFAYGMLCSPKYMSDAVMVGVGELKNFTYEMYVYANVLPEAGSTVYGTLWSVDREKIAELDHIEGYPTLYDRKTVPVHVDGQKFAAEVYVMTTETRRNVQGTHPSDHYIGLVAGGYKHAGVPISQLENAISKNPPQKDDSEWDDYAR